MNITKKKLQSLFDYQRFAGNERLDNMIRKAEGLSSAVELGEEDLVLVNAAGDLECEINARKAFGHKY